MVELKGHEEKTGKRRAAGAVLATQVAACAGAMVWGTAEYVYRGQWSVLGSLTGAIAGLIAELAEFEQLSHLLQLTPEKLAPHLFGPRPVVEAVVATQSSPAEAYPGAELAAPMLQTKGAESWAEPWAARQEVALKAWVPYWE